VQCRILPLEIASELERLTGCHEIKRHDKMKMKSLDPDCHFIADLGEIKIRRLEDPTFSERMYECIAGHSDGGYESDDSDDDRDENELKAGEFVDEIDVECEIDEKRNNE
jgi:hypothetical protein